MPWFIARFGGLHSGLTLCGTLLAVVLATISGCGGPNEPAGRVSGKVTSPAGPVTEANVQLVRADGVPIGAASLNASGEFTFEKTVPVGDYQVAVLPIVEEVPAEDVDPRRHQEVIKRIPQKYWDSHTSGLNVTVKEGDNSLTLSLQ